MLLKIVALILLFTAVVIVLLQFLGGRESIEAQERLEGKEKKKSRFLLYRILSPLLEKFLIPSIEGNKKLDEYRRTKQRTLIAAGLGEELTPDELFSFKMGLAGFLPIATFLIFQFGVPIIAYPLLGILGWFMPDILISGIIKRRHKEIILAMPFVVDMLTLSTEAGLDFMASIARVVEKARPSPIVDEFKIVLQEIQLGSTRADALRKMSWRLSMEEINSFIAVLISADQMGASIGEVLRAQSDSIRAERFIRAEKMGAAATQLILLPLIFLIMPAVFIVVFGPLLVKFITGGLF